MVSRSNPRVMGKPVHYLPGVEAVTAGERKLSLSDWIRIHIAGSDR